MLPCRGGERAAGHVIVALARGQNRSFADHAFAIDDIDRSAAIGDAPVAGEQLDSLARAVLKPDVIDPEPLSSFDPGLIGHEVHRDPHGDPLRNRGMLEQLFHESEASVIPSAFKRRCGNSMEGRQLTPCP